MQSIGRPRGCTRQKMLKTQLLLYWADPPCLVHCSSHGRDEGHPPWLSMPSEDNASQIIILAQCSFAPCDMSATTLVGETIYAMYILLSIFYQHFIISIIHLYACEFASVCSESHNCKRLIVWGHVFLLLPLLIFLLVTHAPQSDSMFETLKQYVFEVGSLGKARGEMGEVWGEALGSMTLTGQSQ